MNTSGNSSYIKMTPKPIHEASHSNTKDLEKLGMAKTGVLHMAFFKVETAFFVASFHENEFLFSSVVKGVEILP